MQRRHTESQPSPGWLRVLSAPWLGAFRPATAAARLVTASPGRFWVVYSVHAVALGIVIVLLAIWDAKVQTVWVPPATPPRGAPTSSPGALGYVALGLIPELKVRSFAEVWRAWHVGSPVGPAEFAFFLALIVAVVGTGFLAWLNLPRLHRAGPVTPAFSRAFRTVATAGGLLLSLTTVAGLLTVGLSHLHRVATASVPFLADMLVLLIVPISIAVIIQRIGRALAGVGDRPFEVHLPPRCEGCGYDLTHQRPDARCPECGLPINESVSRRRRPGCRWERSVRWSFREWLETVQMVILLPGEFYRKLRLRTRPAAATAFAVRSYVFIGIAAGVWVLLMWWAGASDFGEFPAQWDEVLPLLLTFGLWTPLVCWLGHRLVGAFAISWWMFRRCLPDTRWAAKVLAYESAYLWVLCAFWGALATSFALIGERWITAAFGAEFFVAVFGTPGEVVAFLGGTGLLTVVWVWRYRVALRAIRWSNY